MNILVEGYLDRNFGDDMMIRIIAHYLKDCKLFLREEKKELLLPFVNDNNILDWKDKQDTNIDLILRITGSGFMLKNKLHIYYFLLNLFRIIRLRKKNIPRAVIGCNIGPFFSKYAKIIATLEMRQYDLFTVRDSYSYNFIKDNLKNTPIFLYPDILFSIPKDWLPHPHKNVDCLGISTYRMQDCSNLEYYSKMAEITDRYIEINNKKVLLFAFDIERENDLAAAFTIRSLCKNKNLVEIISHNDDGSNILNNMARCSQFIAIRLHSLILAIRMGIPVTPIIYSNKTDYILDDLSYKGERFYINNFTVNDILNYQNKKQVFTISNDVFKNAKNHAAIIKDTFLKGNI